MYYGIEKSFSLGRNKHSDKRNKIQGQGVIYSYGDRKNLIDLSANLCNFLKRAYPELRYVKDIKSRHIQDFLNDCTEGCSQRTLEQYMSRIRKLEIIINAVYKLNVRFTRGGIVPRSSSGSDNIRKVAMCETDYEALIESMKDSESCAKIGVELAGRFGLRVSEITKLQKRDIDVEHALIHVIDSKGRRNRDIPIGTEDMMFCIGILDGLQQQTSRVVPLRADSVNRFLSRYLKKLCKSEYAEAKTGIHAIRKLYAQRYFNKCRAEGKSIKLSMQETSVVLGHGRERYELMHTYIGSIK